MKVYVAVTGLLFLALTVAHVLRVFQEQHLMRDPFFVSTTIIALALASWALLLFWNVMHQRPAANGSLS